MRLLALCVVSYLPWFELFFHLLNYIADVMKCCSSETELRDVESLLEHLMSADVSKPLQHIDVTLPSSGLVSRELMSVIDMIDCPSRGSAAVNVLLGPPGVLSNWDLQVC